MKIYAMTEQGFNNLNALLPVLNPIVSSMVSQAIGEIKVFEQPEAPKAVEPKQPEAPKTEEPKAEG